jgi:hypothetical protein
MSCLLIIQSGPLFREAIVCESDIKSCDREPTSFCRDMVTKIALKYTKDKKTV